MQNQKRLILNVKTSLVKYKERHNAIFMVNVQSKQQVKTWNDSMTLPVYHCWSSTEKDEHMKSDKHGKVLDQSVRKKWEFWAALLH